MSRLGLSAVVVLVLLGSMVAVVGAWGATTYDFPLVVRTDQIAPNVTAERVYVRLAGGQEVLLADFAANDDVTNPAWLGANATDLSEILDKNLTLMAPVKDLLGPGKRGFIYGDVHPIWVRVALGDTSLRVTEIGDPWYRTSANRTALVYFVAHFCADVAVDSKTVTDREVRVHQSLRWRDP